MSSPGVVKVYDPDLSAWVPVFVGRRGTSGVVKSDTPPSDEEVLWVDTSETATFGAPILSSWDSVRNDPGGTTTNYAWPKPADADVVKDGAQAIRNLADAADTQVKQVEDYVEERPGATVEIYDEVLSGVATTGSISIPSGVKTIQVTVARRATTGMWSVLLRINGESSGYITDGQYFEGTTVTHVTGTAWIRIGYLPSGVGNVGVCQALIPQAQQSRRHLVDASGWMRNGSTSRKYIGGGMLDGSGTVSSIEVLIGGGDFDGAEVRVIGVR